MRTIKRGRLPPSPRKPTVTRNKPIVTRPHRSDDADAFFPDPDGGPAHTHDDLAEELAEEFLRAATSGEDSAGDELNAEVPEEEGGPFVETSARQEFARGTDASNPKGSRREALPTVRDDG